MKKISVLLAALMLVMAMLPGSAMAYTAPVLDQTSFDHTLTLTNALNKLEDDTVIAYKYSVGTAQMMVLGDTTTFTTASGVSGSPVIRGNCTDAGSENVVIFNNQSTFDDGVCEETVTVDWSKVIITEPGVYLWEVTKGIDTQRTSTNENTKPSDYDTTFYLYAIVLRNNTDELTRKAHGISMENSLDDKSGKVDDQYPVMQVSLSIKKKIDGDMASSNQYFSFSIDLDAGKELEYDILIDGMSVSSIPPTVYNGGQVCDTSIETDANGHGSATIWLKHDQTAVIAGLPYGSSYSITEGANNGFEVSAIVSGSDTADVKNNADTTYEVSDTSLKGDVVVTYTNKKDPTVPTGIMLETAAPVMGILLAMSLLAILFIGKRKESAV